MQNGRARSSSASTRSGSRPTATTLFAGYQAGRDFPPELTDQLDRLPVLVAALGFSSAKEAGFEADDFLAAAARAETETGGRRSSSRATATPSSWPAPPVTLVMPSAA